MFKYIGSKRVFVPVLGSLARNSGARTAVDLFTGTTRVAQEFKRSGIVTTAADLATYSHVLAQTYIELDSEAIDQTELEDALRYLSSLVGEAGYFTQTFCLDSRFFQPHNGERIDAIREAIEAEFCGTDLYPVLLTSLMEAADRVDSTTGVQMAYLKDWAPRSYNDLELKFPAMLPGTGIALHGDATQLIHDLPETDLLYLDPPYNQHRYFTNYHIWETLVRWDKPPTYGVAHKRIDSRDQATKSVFNSKPRMKEAFFTLLEDARANLLLISYNNESWITADEMIEQLYSIGCESVVKLAFEHSRYVGARIGIHNPAGKKVGKISHTRNTEWIFVAGPASDVQQTIVGYEDHRKDVPPTN
ncbi:MAG: DNA adenine methylase [Actinomycetaceae bacterium]|nr:DNA adenine methylase [Actinomycetaceae bacterium]